MAEPRVVVEDTADCVDDEEVVAGLGAALGPWVLARLDAHVALEAIEGSVVLAVHADWRDLRWDDAEELAPSECGPRVARLAVDSIVRGTAGWPVVLDRRRTHLELSVSGGAGPWQVAPQVHVGLVHHWGAAALGPVVTARVGGGAAPMVDPARVTVSIEGTDPTAAWVPYGAAQVGGGARYELPAGRSAVRVEALAGPLVAAATGLPRSRTGLAPALHAAGTLEVALSEGALLTSRLEVSPLVVELGTAQVPVEPVRLAPVRVGVGVAARL